MSAPWDDTEFWIEDRGRRGAHLLRGPAGSAGFWTCPNGGWTYVLPIGAPINTPPPPRRAGVTAQAQPQQSAPVETGRGTTPTATTPTTNTRGHSGRNNFDTQSTDSSTDSRHWESPTFRADTARHQRFLNERFQDEPVWNPRGRPRNDPRGGSTREYAEDRARPAERYAYDAAGEDAMRARDIRAIRARPYNANGRRDERRSDEGRPDERRAETANPARPATSPSAQDAPRGADGHPQAPRAAARDLEDELLPDPEYVMREEERLARSRAKASQDRARGVIPVARPREDRGMWRTLHVGTIAQALNLCEWLELGETNAYEKFQHVVQSCAAAPTDFRAEGEAYLLRHQQQLERSYWIATTGAARPPRGERTKAAPNSASGSRANPPAAGPSRQEVVDVDAPMDDITPEQCAPSPKKKTVAQVTASMWSFGLVLPMAAPLVVAPPPAEHTVHVDSPGYFGTSAPDPTDVAPAPAGPGEFRVWHGLPNSRATVLEVLRYYEFAPTNMWTVGMRNRLGERPNGEGDSPRIGDALSYATWVALGPPDRRNYAHQWRRFYDTGIMMMSIPGLFHHIVTQGGYPPGSEDMAHFGGLTDNITMPYVAAHVVRHGIPTTGPIIEQMEAFARSRRNMRAGIPDLNQVGWEDEPRSVRSAMSADVASIPSWAIVSGPSSSRPPGPSRPNPVTLPPPSTQAVGIHASMHAPMDVEPEGFQISSGVPGVLLINDPIVSGVLLINDPVHAELPAPPPETPESDTDAEAEADADANADTDANANAGAASSG
ncbi:hypothetical protein DFH06DRAFT_1321241 [Mycena polygramma]|nr:hypothetical protein DFH06DRAFT_1321241 [Mycena polygramma]